MKSVFGILLLGILGAASAFLIASRYPALRTPSLSPSSSPTVHSVRSHPHDRAHDPSGTPADPGSELAWLRSEFRLDEPTFQRVRQLHEAYRPHCEDLCRRIDNHNRRLESVLFNATGMTAETRQLVEEGARLRSECHLALTAHLLEVARCMPPAEGRRYLQKMLSATGITGASHPIGEFTHAPPHEE